ncbi:MAG: helix-turn-helix domain-containing protein [bacterium]|nr:helix-turn-helix domain-containing protein [bacterium]
MTVANHDWRGMRGGRVNRESLLKEVGARIKAVRSHLKLNQSLYADKLGISQAFLSFVEQGRRKPSFDLLWALVVEFDVDLRWVMTEAGEMFAGETVTAESSLTARFINVFPQVPPEQDVMDMVATLEVPIMRNALVEKFLLYKKRYEEFIAEHFGKKNQAVIER